MVVKITPSHTFHHDYLKESKTNSMFLTPTNEIETQNIIAELN